MIEKQARNVMRALIAIDAVVLIIGLLFRGGYRIALIYTGLILLIPTLVTYVLLSRRR
jgi:hypothetical protein